MKASSKKKLISVDYEDSDSDSDEEVCGATIKESLSHFKKALQEKVTADKEF